LVHSTDGESAGGPKNEPPAATEGPGGFVAELIR